MDQLWIVPIEFSDARQLHLDMSMPVDFQFLLQSGLHKFFLLQSYKLFSPCFLYFFTSFYYFILDSYFICPAKEIIR